MAENTWELRDTTNALMQEIRSPKCTQRDVAQTYRMAMESQEQPDWETVNTAIIERWSVAGLIRIKRMARTGKCWG